MTGYFDATEAFTSLGLIAVVLCWGLILLTLLLVPGLALKTYEAYTSQRQEGIAMYISRFVPFWLYYALVLLAGALSLSVIVLWLATGYGYLPETLEAKAYLLVLGGAVLAQAVVWVWRTLSFALWRYAFMSRQGASLLQQDYLLLQLGQLVVLLPLMLLGLSEVSLEVKLWSLVGVVALVQLGRIVQAWRRLWRGAEDGVYLFLYLCTHEIVPLVYTLALVVWGMGRLQAYMASI